MTNAAHTRLQHLVSTGGIGVYDADDLFADIAALLGENARLLTLIRRVIDHCPFCRNGTCRAETHAWLREAV